MDSVGDIYVSSSGGGRKKRKAIASRPKGTSINSWLKSILTSKKNYPCYAFFLMFPNNKDVIEFFSDTSNVSTLDKASNTNCLITLITEKPVDLLKIDKSKLKKLFEKYSNEELSIELSKVFNVPLNEFPCILFFQNLDSRKHISLTFKDMDSTKINDTMINAFTLIQQAVISKKDPIQSLMNNRKKEEFINNAKPIINELVNIGKTTATEAIKAAIAVLKIAA